MPANNWTALLLNSRLYGILMAESRPNLTLVHLLLLGRCLCTFSEKPISLAICSPADKEELRNCSAKNGDLELRKWIT